MKRKLKRLVVTLYFRVDGFTGAQVYVVDARDNNEALGDAWAALCMEALNLGLVDLSARNKTIAYRATVRAA